MNKIKIPLKILSVVLLIMYPICIYFGLKHLSVFFLAPIIIVICLIRLVTLEVNVKELLWVMRIILTLTIFLSVLALIMKSVSWMLYYPVLVNIVMLATFSYSLISPPSMIECFARLQHPNLPEEGVLYTRKVTQIWCAFFVLNGTISIITTQLNIEYWTLYNGLISYILMSLLFVGEWIYRKMVLKII